MNDSLTPNVSFVIIAYNEELTIRRCLDSIAVQESLESYEVIIVDDGSKDNTVQIVQDYIKGNSFVKILPLITNQGRGAARAAGVKVARGNFIAFIDADIILPKNWLQICMSYMSEYDAVGGIAVPDGDVNYIYSTFNLPPKKIHHTTTITGNNGLYNKRIFNGLNFDSNLRDGEDVAFNHFMDSAKFKTRSIDSLEVMHKESKSFATSLKWLYQTGIGASRQFKQFGKIRFPDLVLFGFMLLVVLDIIISLILRQYYLLVLIPLYVLLVSAVHLYTRFYFKFSQIFSYILSILVDSLLIFFYLFGRIVGLLKNRPTSLKKHV